MEMMLAFGLASTMLCMGMFLRAKVPLFRHMLVPASVLGGLIGFAFLNAFSGTIAAVGISTEIYTSIVNQLFVISFISISLTNSSQENMDGRSQKILKGALALGMIWNLLYALTPLVGMGIIFLFGRNGEPNLIYGALVQFAFCQGPGQAAAYGAIFEQYGWENASMTAVTFAAIGFMAAFLLGVPAAKVGIKRGLAKYCRKLDEQILKGYFSEKEQKECRLKDTTCNSNIETLSFHFALIGICYLLAAFIGKILASLPGFLGTSMSSMMFMNGMYAAYIIKFIMKKLHLHFLQENVLQNKITGWTADYLVVCSFMAISVSVIRQWLSIIVIISLAITAVTFLVCFYFGRRIGEEHDFERTLGLYGMCTGTVPSGIAIVRIVDPDFHTTTAIELGACNLVMLASTPVYLIVLAMASGTIKVETAIGGLAICVVLYLIILKVTKCWGKTTFDWGNKS